MKEHYYRQFVFYLNDADEKIAFVNAFCEIPEEAHYQMDSLVWKPFDWKNRYLDIDGGSVIGK